MGHKSKRRPAKNKRKKDRFAAKHGDIEKNRRGFPSRTAYAKAKRKAHPYVVQKRSPEATAEKLRIKEIKRLRYEKRAQALKRLEQK